ncbi:MAG: hypothetical protein ACT4P5_09865 [Armatimonadota bacterium]
MAEPIGVEFTVQGVERVRAGMQQIEGGLQRTSNVARETGERVEQVGRRATDAFGRTRAAMSNLAAGLSGIASVISNVSRGNEELAAKFDLAERAMFTVSATARALAANLRLVIGVLGLKIAIIAGVITAVVLLITRWEQAKQAAIRIWGDIVDYLGRIWAGLATAARGLGEILFGALTFNLDRIRAGWEGLTAGLRQLGGIAVELGRGALNLLNLGLDKLRGTSVAAKGGVAKLGEETGSFAKSISGLAIPAQQAWINMAARWEAAAKSVVGALGAIKNSVVEVADAMADPMNLAIGLFERFRRPEEEGMPSGREITENLEEIADAARLAARVLGVEWAEALTIAREALKMARKEGIGLAEALQRIKFNRDFLKDLEAVGTGMQRWFKSWGQFKFGPEDLAISEPEQWVGDAPKKIGDEMRHMLTGLKDGFKGFFVDVLSGAKDFGDAFLGFFRNVVNSIINMLAEIAAKWIFKSLFGTILGLQHGGIVAGGLIPALALQGGGVIHRPTLAMVGEGARSEAVVPLPDNRSIPVTFTNGRGGGRDEREILLTVNVLFDPNQIPRTSPGEIVATVAADMRNGGITSTQVKLLAGRR